MFAKAGPYAGKISDEMYEIRFSRKAAKFYQKTDTLTAKRLNLAFAKLSEDPAKLRNVKPLVGVLEGSFRMRIGDTRIIYSVNDEDKIVYVEVIGSRGNVYKKW